MMRANEKEDCCIGSPDVPYAIPLCPCVYGQACTLPQILCAFGIGGYGDKGSSCCQSTLDGIIKQAVLHCTVFGTMALTWCGSGTCKLTVPWKREGNLDTAAQCIA